MQPRALTTADTGPYLVHVPWVPTKADIALLTEGGTLWLTCEAGLPPHDMVVLP